MSASTSQSQSQQLQKKIQVADVLRHELETLKPGRKVYVQQPGSQVFMKSDINNALRNCHETLKSLRQEYQQLQTPMDDSK